MRVIKWYVDASFEVHPAFNSHVGGLMMWVTGATEYGSMKKKLNRRSIMEGEVFGVDNMVSKTFWKKMFIEDQRYNV